MKSYDYEAMAYDGAVYCTGCLPDGVSEDDADPVFADSEWDYYPTCDSCGFQHDYVCLTDHGRKNEAVQEAIREHEQGEFDGLEVSDLSDVPEDYEGMVLEINDHGNVTLYSVSAGKFQDCGSCV